MMESAISKPLVSIIVPVYNVERYIKRCVDSLQGQTLQNIEIILVDDGSKDNSGCLCDEFAQQDPRIHVIHKQNAGQGLARNDGLNIAKGRYVLFIDSDDFIEPDTCEKLSDRMQREQADLCSFGYQIETPQGELFYRAQLKEQCYGRVHGGAAAQGDNCIRLKGCHLFYAFLSALTLRFNGILNSPFLINFFYLFFSIFFKYSIH